MGHTLSGGKEPPESEGSTLAPLSTVFVNYMMEGKACTPIRFADDTKLVGSDDILESRAVIY